MIGRKLRLVAPMAALLWMTTLPAAAADVDFQVTQERPDGYRAEVVIRNPGEKPITDWSLEFSADRAIERAWGAEMSRTGENRYRFRPDPWTRDIAAGGQAKFTVAGPPSEKPLQPAGVDLDARYAAVADAPAPSKPKDAQAAEGPPKSAALPAEKPKSTAKPKPAPPDRQPVARSREAEQRASLGAAAGSASVSASVRHTIAFKLQSSWESGFTAEVVVVNGSDRTVKPWRLEFELEGDIIEMWNADFRKVGARRYVVTPKSYNDQIDPNGFATFGFKTSTAFASRPDDSRLSALN